MQYTYNYRLRLPQGGEHGKISDFNFNANTIDNALADNRSISVAMYDSNQTYDTGEMCGYESAGHIKAYKCKVDGTTGTWDSTKWDETDLGSEIEYLSAHSTEVIPNPVDVPTAKLNTVKINGTTYVSGGDAANQNIAEAFDDTATYTVGTYCIYEDVLYKCTTAVTTAGDFDPYNWTQCVVTDELGSGGSGLPYEELTQEAYDLITPEHNKAYFIKDTNGDEDVFQPIIYSENERELGVWTDGKPLYQKTLVLPSEVSLSAGTWANSGCQISGIEIILKASVIRSDSFGPWTISVGYNSSTGDIQLYSNAAISLGAGSTIIIQYTKSTDTPGSGTWTPQGVPAIHFSEDEHVVGTWIDGSTIYEKTIVADTIYNDNDWHDIAHDIDDFNVMVNMTAVAYTISGSAYTYYLIPAPRPNLTPPMGFCITVDPTNISYVNNWMSASGAYFTIQYTKTI